MTLPSNDAPNNPVVVEDDFDAGNIAERCRLLEDEANQLSAKMLFGLHQLDLAGTYLAVNLQELSWLGYLRIDLIGNLKFSDLMTADSQQRYQAVIEKLSSTMAGKELDIELESKNGLINSYTLHIKVMQSSDGQLQGYQCVLFTLNDRNFLDTQLRIAATVFESIEGMMVTDERGIILNVNRAFTHITGYLAEEVIGLWPRVLSSDIHDHHFYDSMKADLHNNGSWVGEIWNRHKEGVIYPERLAITAVRSPDGKLTNYVGIFSDITERKHAADKIEQLAFYDPLTKLPNRRLLMDRLHHAMNACERTEKEGAVLYLDLDDFKDVNNSLGHEVGDDMLKEVAKRLIACIRKVDSIARLGGDEFVVVLEELSQKKDEALAEVSAICQKILSTLNQTYSIRKHELRSSVSIGAVLFENGNQSIDDLLKQADIAMYQSKKLGRNRVTFFEAEMQEVINTRAVLEFDMHKAVEDEQLELFYQVQVDEKGEPVGAEGLIRWHHPEQGLILPNQFISFAEETDMILLLGRWVLETACIQLKKWQKSPMTRQLVLSVNVSAKQFRQHGFLQEVQTIVQQYGINPKLLKLEITESMLLNDIEDTIVKMDTLKGEGICFSLDDFGTGYSSLQYLKRLPLGQLKIDRSFVCHLESDASDQTIVSMIIAMASSLNISVIAEGVETEIQRDLLLEKGCKLYQGYLFGKPVPVTEFEALLEQMSN